MTCFGEALVDRICGIKIWTDLDVDSLELIKNPLGSSISAICYNNLFRDEEDPICPIPRLGLRPRERIFWWRVYKKLLPTLVRLSRCGLGADTLCPVGCDQLEDRDHITSHCRCLEEGGSGLACAVGLLHPKIFFFEELQMALRRDSSAKKQSAVMYCNAIFQCWGNRNATKHGKAMSSPRVMAANILVTIKQCYFLVSLKQRFTNQSLGLSNSSSWCPPLYGLVEN